MNVCVCVVGSLKREEDDNYLRDKLWTKREGNHMKKIRRKKKH